MPIVLNWEEHGVVWHCSGHITLHDVMEADDSLYGNLAFNNTRYLIIDCLAVLDFDLSPTEIRLDVTNDTVHALKHESADSESVQIAFVVPNQALADVADVYAEQFKKKRLLWQVAKFSDIASARQWIDGHK
ncbi:hypothetical protein [Aestuariibacter salexigens]|uniref:hypothetical protein n=1 Tax=Aestuariibacter salexigens TaxID=226010 RepID=UPI0003FCC787|nr:hypothetical protein [Aestuariibacter salexigens]